jgi:hypothetical protein
VEYGGDLDIIQLMKEMGGRGMAITLRYDPERLFNRFTLISPDGRICDTDEPAEALWEWMKEI